jgi:hypothetical protein
MKRSARNPLSVRLARLKKKADCVLYFKDLPLRAELSITLSIYGYCPTGEIFLEISDGETTRVRSFRSRAINYPVEARRV